MSRLRCSAPDDHRHGFGPGGHAVSGETGVPAVGKARAGSGQYRDQPVTVHVTLLPGSAHRGRPDSSL
jgi:hypothetical protein